MPNYLRKSVGRISRNGLKRLVSPRASLFGPEAAKANELALLAQTMGLASLQANTRLGEGNLELGRGELDLRGELGRGDLNIRQDESASNLQTAELQRLLLELERERQARQNTQQQQNFEDQQQYREDNPRPYGVYTTVG